MAQPSEIRTHPALIAAADADAALDNAKADGRNRIWPPPRERRNERPRAQ